MSWFSGLKYAIIRKDSKEHTTTHRLLGFDKYDIDQSDKDTPFEEGYIKSSDVYAIVNKIVKNAITIPWKLMLKQGDESEEVTSGRLYDILHKPNPAQEKMEFDELALTHLLLSGNTYFNPEVLFGFSLPSELYLLHPQLVEIINKFEGRFNTVDKYVYHINGKEFKIPKENITHLKYANPSRYGIETLYGLSPLTAGHLTLLTLNGNQEASASILRNQGVGGILSNESDYMLNPAEQKHQQKLLDSKIKGTSKFGSILQSMSKVKYTRLGLDPSQLKIIESKVLKMRDLCNIYDVSSVLFNDPQNRIQSNLVPAETAFWKNGVLPPLERYKDSYERAIIDTYNSSTFENREAKYYIKLDTSGVPALQKNEKEKAETGKALSEGVVNILQSPISDQQKINVLIYSYAMTEDEATQLVNEN